MKINEEKIENTPAGGALVGKKDGQTIIHDKGTMSGYLVGKLHKDGGIKAINKATGQPLEMQGGEVVITAPAVSDQTKREFEGKMMTNREILSAINEKGGGVSFANGGDIPAKINITDKEYEYGGKMVNDSEIARQLGWNSTLKKGGQLFSFFDRVYDIDKAYKLINSGEIIYEIKEVDTFPVKYSSMNKEYSKNLKPDFSVAQGLMVKYDNGQDLLIDGNHRMNNAYENGIKKIKVFYISNPKTISKFSKKSKFELGGENKVGGHLSKNKSLKQIAEMHNVSMAHINGELAKGLEVEKEHFADFKERTRVAKDHLVENPNYYTLLQKAGLKRGGKIQKQELVKNSEKGDTPARDLNNYNDILDVQADGAVGGDNGLAFADGGKIDEWFEKPYNLRGVYNKSPFEVTVTDFDCAKKIKNKHKQVEVIRLVNPRVKIPVSYVLVNKNWSSVDELKEMLIECADNISSYGFTSNEQIEAYKRMSFANGGNIDGGVQVGDLFVMDLPDIWKNQDYGRKRQVGIVTNIDNPERILIYNGRVYFNIKETSLLSKKKSSISEVLNEFRNKNDMSISQDLKGVISLLSKEVISQKTIDLLKERYPNRNVYVLNSDNEKTQDGDFYAISIEPKNLTDKRTLIEKINGYYLITQINFKQDYYYIFDSIEDAINLKYGQPIYADGGELGNEPKEGDLITNFGKYGVSIIDVDNKYVYWLDQYASRQYCKKSDLSLNNLDDDGGNDGYYEGERNNWVCNKSFSNGGVTPYDANLDGDSIDVIENGFAKGGVVYDATKPKIEKVTIKETRFDGNASVYSGSRENIIGRNASTVSELQQIVSDYIGSSPKEEYDWIAFYVNDGTKGRYYIELNKGKKNTVKNVNPETLNSVNFKRVIDRKSYLVKNYDWTDFFEGASSKPASQGVTSQTQSQVQYPEYYEFVDSSSDSFTKGKIYKIKNPKNLEAESNFIDDEGNQNGFSGNNAKFFKPSTEEAFLTQKQGVSSTKKQNVVQSVRLNFEKQDGTPYDKILADSGKMLFKGLQFAENMWLTPENDFFRVWFIAYYTDGNGGINSMSEEFNFGDKFFLPSNWSYDSFKELVYKDWFRNKLDFSEFFDKKANASGVQANTKQTAIKTLTKDELPNTKIWIGDDVVLRDKVISKLEEIGFILDTSLGDKNFNKGIHIFVYTSDFNVYSGSKLEFDLDNIRKEIFPSDLGIDVNNLNVSSASSTSSPNKKDPEVQSVLIEYGGNEYTALNEESLLSIMRDIWDSKDKTIRITPQGRTSALSFYKIVDLVQDVTNEAYQINPNEITPAELRVKLKDDRWFWELDWSDFFKYQTRKTNIEVNKVVLTYDTGTLREIVCNNGSELLVAYKLIEEQAEGDSLQVEIKLSGKDKDGQFFETQGIPQEVGKGGFEPSQIYSIEEFENTVRGMFPAFEFDNFFSGVSVPNIGVSIPQSTKTQNVENMVDVVTLEYFMNNKREYKSFRGIKSLLQEFEKIENFILNFPQETVSVKVIAEVTHSTGQITFKIKTLDFGVNDFMSKNWSIDSLQKDLFEEMFNKELDFSNFFSGANVANNSAPALQTPVGKKPFDFTDTKIDVKDNPELSVKVQQKAFENGWEWENRGGKTIDYNSFNYLYFSKTSISYGNKTLSFVKSPKRKITEEEIFGGQAPAVSSSTVSNANEIEPYDAYRITLIWKDNSGKEKIISLDVFNGKSGEYFINLLKNIEAQSQGKNVEVIIRGFADDNDGNQFEKNDYFTIGEKGFKPSAMTNEQIKSVVEQWIDGMSFDKFFADVIPLSGSKAPATQYKPIDLSQTKIWIGDNEDVSKQIQERAFELGWAWLYTASPKSLQYTEFPALYFNEDKDISYGSSREGFDKFDDFREITLEDLFAKIEPAQIKQTPTISGSSGSVREIEDLKEAVDVLEGIASQASQKYNTKKYEESLQLLKEVKEEYALALSFTPESSFMYERIELMKKIAEIQKEITRITELKNGGAYYILSKVIERLNRGENWKELGNGEIMVNEVPQQEIDTVIYTEKFKNWFGDWEQALITKEYDYVSKAITESGKPCVMYHGAKRIKFSYRQVSNGVVYLAENRSYAEWFSANESPYQKQGDYLTQCFVNLKNPIDLTPFGVEEVDLRDIIQYIDALYPLAKIYDVLPPNTAMAIMNNQLIGRNFRAWYIIRQFPELNKHIRDNTTYDGFIYYENNPSDMIRTESGGYKENVTKATAVFNSNQVKLVDAMLFDASLDDWRFETGGKVN